MNLQRILALHASLAFGQSLLPFESSLPCRTRPLATVTAGEDVEFE